MSTKAKYLTIEEAAVLLVMSPMALRCRLRRSLIKDKRTGKIEAPLGDGIVGVKIGRSWRIRLPEGMTP